MTSPAAFVPRVQSDIAATLLAYRTSDPQVNQALLPTDLSIGSLERAHVESVAMLLEEDDQRFALGALNAISRSCYRAFGFSPLPPAQALGAVIFSAYVQTVYAIDIPAGTQLIATTGALFQTTADATLGAGYTTTDSVPVQAVVAGVSGNVAAQAISSMVTSIPGIDVVVNPSPSIGGSDTETDDAMASRFSAFIATIPRGTKSALKFAALSSTPALVDAVAIEPFLMVPRAAGIPDAGLVWLFCDDGSASTYSGGEWAPPINAGVLSAIGQWVEGYTDGTGREVPGYKAAGTVVLIQKVGRVPVYVRGAITVMPSGVPRWSAIQSALNDAAANYFQNLVIGQPASYGNLITALTNADQDISEVQMAFWEGPTPSGGAGTTPPGYSDPLDADDLSFLDPANAISYGFRGTLFSGTDAGPDGVTPVTYPEWILA